MRGMPEADAQNFAARNTGGRASEVLWTVGGEGRGYVQDAEEHRLMIQRKQEANYNPFTPEKVSTPDSVRRRRQEELRLAEMREARKRKLEDATGGREAARMDTKAERIHNFPMVPAGQSSIQATMANMQPGHHVPIPAEILDASKPVSPGPLRRRRRKGTPQSQPSLSGQRLPPAPDMGLVPDQVKSKSGTNESVLCGREPQRPRMYMKYTISQDMTTPEARQGALLIAIKDRERVLRPKLALSIPATLSASVGTASGNSKTKNKPLAKPEEIETPISALPSRFDENGLLPSPSSFYPEWRVGQHSDRLPSPLTFDTPVGPNGPSLGHNHSDEELDSAEEEGEAELDLRPFMRTGHPEPPTQEQIMYPFLIDESFYTGKNIIPGP